MCCSQDKQHVYTIWQDACAVLKISNMCILFGKMYVLFSSYTRCVYYLASYMSCSQVTQDVYTIWQDACAVLKISNMCTLFGKMRMLLELSDNKIRSASLSMCYTKYRHLKN